MYRDSLGNRFWYQYVSTEPHELVDKYFQIKYTSIKHTQIFHSMEPW